MTVSDLIYHDDYSIDANGKQIPITKSSIDITPENVDQVMAQYSDEIAAAGFTDEQVAMAVEAVKNGTLLPDDIMAAMQQYGISIPTIADHAGDTSNNTSNGNGTDAPKAQSNK